MLFEDQNMQDVLKVENGTLYPFVWVGNKFSVSIFQEIPFDLTLQF